MLQLKFVKLTNRSPPVEQSHFTGPLPAKPLVNCIVEYSCLPIEIHSSYVMHPVDCRKRGIKTLC